MTDPDTPTDPEQLRAEIEQTRAELGETVQELAAKADVKARAKQAAGDTAAKVRQKLSDVKGQAGQATGAVAERASTVKQQLAGSDLPAPMRRPLPLAAIAAAVAAVVVVIVVARRRTA
ncbi:hypothetical protein Aab01nite_54720 [Paractinoplanes abujensis]|uniref:Preprotein translocase subunit SecF n=1 Tax=Paractinoplanes abujensis TaxID=882441 RepID=A0A7W7G295_9ACTN|nr:DUF3618 domain-containing protein [Actinoplanes abujensis]MBB4693459.1 preprotein translocase subunit SecF [Actinoplanes abujensis]GID21882.1 hypothetical protein Aab01nite_54720 [Actinoplanes abujensis]